MSLFLPEDFPALRPNYGLQLTTLLVNGPLLVILAKSAFHPSGIGN